MVRDQLLRSVAKLARTGRVPEAVDLYEGASRDRRADDWAVLNFIGDLCAASGDGPRAAAYFDRAARQLADKGLAAQAQVIYGKAIRWAPDGVRDPGTGTEASAELVQGPAELPVAATASQLVSWEEAIPSAADADALAAGCAADTDSFVAEARARVIDRLLSEAEEALKDGLNLLPTHPKDGVARLRAAASALPLRFRASAQISLHLRGAGDEVESRAWLIRASDALEIDVSVDHALTYDVACALEADGEVARAYSAFLRLQHKAGAGHRDVEQHLERIATAIS